MNKKLKQVLKYCYGAIMTYQKFSMWSVESNELQNIDLEIRG